MMRRADFSGINPPPSQDCMYPRLNSTPSNRRRLAAEQSNGFSFDLPNRLCWNLFIDEQSLPDVAQNNVSHLVKGRLPRTDGDRRDGDSTTLGGVPLAIAVDHCERLFADSKSRERQTLVPSR